MTLTNTEYKYVQLDKNNVPIIAGTTMKVVELVTSVMAYGWSPEELHFQYPHVSLSKIHSSLVVCQLSFDRFVVRALALQPLLRAG
ncbi:DUF433 domain-containing protein [Microcoleus sp. FACHB-53]|nr:DUF433 domain-containing protein [Microcoleus sp. FACHB-53]